MESLGCATTVNVSVAGLELEWFQTRIQTSLAVANNLLLYLLLVGLRAVIVMDIRTAWLEGITTVIMQVSVLNPP